MVKDASTMKNESRQMSVTIHKEEMPERKSSDDTVRDELREILITCINPLMINDQPDRLVNIVTGTIAPAAVNGDTATRIRIEQMKYHEAQWPVAYTNLSAKKSSR